MSDNAIPCDMLPTGETNAVGVALYRCSRCNRGPWPSKAGRFAPIACGRRVKAATVAANAERPTAESLPCPCRGPVVGSVGCGCGGTSATLPVYACSALAFCTVVAAGKPVRFEGVKPAVCLGCDFRPK